MSYQFLCQLPLHLEKAYKAGEVIVNSGVVRFAKTQRIAAHLEQVAPIMIGSSGLFHPHVALANVGLHTIRSLKNLTVDTVLLARVLKLTYEIKSLSTISLAVTSANLGIGLSGFGMVIYQLNSFDKKLTDLRDKINILSCQQSEIFNNEVRKLRQDAQLSIKNSITLVQQIEDFGWSEYLDTEISKQLDICEIMIENAIHESINYSKINIKLELIQKIYISYANLLKVQFTHRFLNKKKLNVPALRLSKLSKLSKLLTSPDIIDILYEEFLFTSEQRLSEPELDYVFDLYRYGCLATYRVVKDHYDILQSTSIYDFQRFQRRLNPSDDPWIWVEHS